MIDLYCAYCLYDDRPGEEKKRNPAITICTGFACCEEHLAWRDIDTFLMHLADERARREGHSERLDTPPARRQLPGSTPKPMGGTDG